MAYFETDHFSLYALAEKAESTDAVSGAATPQTGDAQDIGGYAVLLAVAAAAVFAVLVLDRRRRRRN